jgi:hypothetical protein
VIRFLHAVDRALCLVGRSCCVARSQSAWDRVSHAPPE